MIELRNICVSFDNKTVLNDLSLSLPEEGCVVFRGPSGCGKTTLLRVIAGLIEPQSGICAGLSERKIAMVFQEDRLLPWVSAKENIALISDAETADHMLRSVGLSDDAEQYPSALSGGMRRRIAIARALAYSNDILLLDEPFNGLDPELRIAMAKLIRDHARLILLVTHDAGDAVLLGQTHGFTLSDGKALADMSDPD